MLFLVLGLPSALSLRPAPGLRYGHVLRVRRAVATLSLAPPDDGALASIKAELLASIPRRPFGAPATNVTTDTSAVRRIAQLTEQLEARSPFAGRPFAEDPAALATLAGGWRLIYSDASEITRLVKLPLGFTLGAVFQAIDGPSASFENQALVKHSLLLLSGHTRVVAKFWLSDDLGATNRAGVTNSAGNRINVQFQKAIFTLRRILLLPTFGRVRKVAQPNGPSEQAGVVPSIDVTFLDDSMRVSRGGDGSLFVLTRAGDASGESERPMAMLGGGSADLAVTSASTYNAATDILPGSGSGAS